MASNLGYPYHLSGLPLAVSSAPAGTVMQSGELYNCNPPPPPPSWSTQLFLHIFALCQKIPIFLCEFKHSPQKYIADPL